MLLSVDWLFVDKLFVSSNVGAWGIESGNMRAGTIWLDYMVPVAYVRLGAHDLI